MSTIPGIMKKYGQDKPGNTLTNVVDRCDNHSEEREEKRVMGVRYKGVTDSRSAVPRISRDKRDHVNQTTTLVTVS
jgi:hypothetical protein